MFSMVLGSWASVACHNDRRCPNTLARDASTAADLHGLRRAPGRRSLFLCLQFEASGLVVKVFVCMRVCVYVCVCVRVCSLVRLFVCSFVRFVFFFVSLVGWLVDWWVGCLCQCVLVCVSCASRRLHALKTLLGAVLCLSWILGERVHCLARDLGAQFHAVILSSAMKTVLQIGRN